MFCITDRAVRVLVAGVEGEGVLRPLVPGALRVAAELRLAGRALEQTGLVQELRPRPLGRPALPEPAAVYSRCYRI